MIVATKIIANIVRIKVKITGCKRNLNVQRKDFIDFPTYISQSIKVYFKLVQ